jgi:hypothetical protein
MVIPILLDTYLSVIENSPGTKMFRNLFANIDGKRTDITQNGELSCAFFVTSVLLMFKLIKEPHATVSGTVKDLKDSGWTEIESPKIGSILIWEERDLGTESFHKHVGFYVGDGKAVSNDYKSGVPEKHDWNYNDRKVELILWNSKLNSEK